MSTQQEDSTRTQMSAWLDRDLWFRVKVAALRQGTTATEIVTEALSNWLDVNAPAV